MMQLKFIYGVSFSFPVSIRRTLCTAMSTHSTQNQHVRWPFTLQNLFNQQRFKVQKKKTTNKNKI